MSLAIAVRRRVSARRAARACCGLEAHDSPAPDRRCRTTRRHRNFDPADTHTHIRSDLEQLETDSAACYLQTECGAERAGAMRRAGRKPSKQTIAATGWHTSWRSRYDRHRDRVDTP